MRYSEALTRTISIFDSHTHTYINTQELMHAPHTHIHKGANKKVPKYTNSKNKNV